LFRSGKKGNIFNDLYYISPLFIWQYIKSVIQKSPVFKDKQAKKYPAYLRTLFPKILLLIAIIHIIPFLFLQSPYGGGRGTENSPYLISNARHLANVRNNAWFSLYFKQTADIDLSDYLQKNEWNPIMFFNGVYDGNGYKIINLQYDDYARSRSIFDKEYFLFEELWQSFEILYGGIHGGLFGIVNDQGQLMNITLENIDITGDGGLVGGVSFGKIVNCHVEGTIKSSIAGGLVGSNEGIIERSSARVKISCKGFSGGLVGINEGIILNSYALGEVSGDERIGGLVGENRGAESLIQKSYSAVRVSGEKKTGGLVGKHADGTIESSYYDEETSGQSDEGKGTPRTTAEMKQQATFEGWDFEEIWDIMENESYPFLRGE